MRAPIVPLGLPPAALHASRDMLHRHGNMSSATVLRILQRPKLTKAFGPAAMLSLGTGLTAEVAQPLIIAVATKPKLDVHARPDMIGLTTTGTAANTAADPDDDSLGASPASDATPKGAPKTPHGTGPPRCRALSPSECHRHPERPGARLAFPATPRPRSRARHGRNRRALPHRRTQRDPDSHGHHRSVRR